MTDVERDLEQMEENIGYPNSYFFSTWEKFASPYDWDGESCSEIACCISYLGGNISKIYVSNYAQGLFNLFNAAGRVVYSDPQPGDFIWFDYGQGLAHTGRVYSVNGTSLKTFEGNVNGYTTWMYHDTSDYDIAAYGRPNYDYTEENVTFSIRDTSPVREYLPYYNNSAENGYNSCSNGNSPDGLGWPGANVMYSAEGYAQGRMMEIYNDIYGGLDDVSPAAWIQGGITANGGNSTTTLRCRTDFLRLDDYYRIDLHYPSGFRGYAFEYSSNTVGSFLQRFPSSGWLPANSSITITPGHYYRFLIAKTANTAITPAEALAAGFTLTGYYGDPQITGPGDNPFSMFNVPAIDWLTTAQGAGFNTGSIPKYGAVGVWSDGTSGHVANVETEENGIWYITEGHYNYGGTYGSWDYSSLGSSPDYLPAFLASEPDWHLLGFIYPYRLQPPQPTPAPPENNPQIYDRLRRRRHEIFY